MEQEIVAGLLKRMRDAGLDAIIAVSPENVAYVSGFVVPSQSLMRWRHAGSMLRDGGGRISMVVIDMEATTVKAHAGIDDLRVYREFTEDPMDKLVATLTDLKLERGKVGIEMEFLPTKTHNVAKKSAGRSMVQPQTRFLIRLVRSKPLRSWNCCVGSASSLTKPSAIR